MLSVRCTNDYLACPRYFFDILFAFLRDHPYIFFMISCALVDTGKYINFNVLKTNTTSTVEYILKCFTNLTN